LQVLIALHREMERRVLERTRSLEDALAQQARLRREMVEVGMRERNAVGRELHDSLCQHLAATALAAQVHADRLTQSAPAESDPALALVRMTRQAINQSRQLASGLLLSGITPLSLATELGEFVAENAHQGTMRCRFEQAGEPRLPDNEAASQVFRIAQEAIRNAVKHARASVVAVRLSGDNQQVQLSVVDDGVGIPPVDRRDFGMGIEIMTYRAASIGAALSVEALPTGGTEVRCTWANRSP
jgi:signal transduction histidine kinase